MKCIYCNKALRKCKRIDFIGRTYHFTCKESERKIEYQKELNDFVEFFKSRNILVVA